MKIDAYESDILNAFESGKMRSVATKAKLEKFREAARTTAIKDRRVNIRLSSGDLADIKVRALEKGLPYQTLIASVLHKYVTCRLVEPPQSATRSFRRRVYVPSAPVSQASRCLLVPALLGRGCDDHGAL